MRRNLFVAAVTLVMSPALVLAQQQRTITGRVTAEGGTEPLAGVTVQVAGTTTGFVTTDDGRYRVVAPDGAVQLIARRIGFKRRTVDVAAGQNAVDISLERDALKLEELVITGQGTAVARRNLANDVATVGAEALTKVQSTSFEGALQGKVPGANIQMNSGAPGGGGQVQIRGITSINGSSDPLWVVDGVIVSNDVLNSGANSVTRAAGGLQPNAQDNGLNRIADLNLNDIENIEVLKGASASSIYGARAANGVIVITTKRGVAGAPRFNITQRAGTFQQLRTLGSRVFTREDALAEYTGPGTLLGANTDSLLKLFGDGTVHDNEQNFFGETPLSYETSVNASGGGESTRYYGSLLHKYDGGIMPNTGSRRQSLRMNVSQNAGSKLTLDMRAAVMRSTDRRGLSNNDNSGTSPYVVFSKTPNFFDLREQNGRFPLNPFERSNPFQTMALSTISENVDRFIVSGTATYQLLTTARQTAQFRVDGGADRVNQQDNIYTPPELQFEPADGLPGTTALTDGQVQNANLNATLTHTYTATGLGQATTAIGLQRELRNVQFANIVNRDLIAGQENINRGTTPLLLQQRQPTKVFAMFAQEELLLLDERLLLTGGVRAERNTNNGDVEKLYYFPKASASYRLPAFAFIDELKLRTSWGRSGNQPLYNQKFTNLTNTVYNGVNALRVALGAGDPNIKPETESEIEGGFDASAFGGRASLSVTVFDKTIDDLIIQPTFAPSSGFTNRFTNGASLQNRGLESMLQLTPLRFRQGEWNSTVIYQKVKPKITDLSVPTFRQGGFALFLGQYQVEEGKSPTQIVGLVPTAEDPDVSAAAIVGDATPDFQMAFNNEVSFGPFRASALVDWRHGGDVINLTTFLYDASHNSADWNTAGRERFALQGKDTRPYVEDGSFVKLREVSVSYRIPESFVQRAFGGRLRTAGLSFTGRNLLMHSDYRGLDPEVSNFGNQALNRNIDVAPFPPSRSLFLSLDLGF